MEQFITWYCSEPRLALNWAVVLRFRLYLESLGLAAGTINQRLAAVRRLAYEAVDSGLLSPELAAGIRRVKGVKQLGSRLGNWLSSDQAKLLLESADGEDLRSIRDLAMMAVLLGCGLRRAELSALKVEDMEARQGHRVIVDLIGKGTAVVARGLDPRAICNLVLPQSDLSGITHDQLKWNHRSFWHERPM